MEWLNKGKELDAIYEKMRNKEFRNIIIYGAGIQGISLSENINLFFKPYCKVTAFIDRRAHEIGSVNGIPVYTLEEIESVRKDEFIICAVNYYSANVVIVTLTRKGYSEWEDFAVYDKWKDLVNLIERDYLRLGLIEIPITEKCSLNCRKCSFFTPYYKNPRHIELDELKKTIDILFEKVDFVNSLRLLGGEPFLYPDFLKLLEYVIKKYRDKFNDIHILTNGTILPSRGIIDFMKQEKCFFLGITDYTKTVDYTKRLNEFTECMQQNGIGYFVDSDKFWVDLGYPEKKQAADDKKSKERFFDCAMHCRTAYQQKLWYCAFESSAYRAGIITALADSDYYNLQECDNKRELLEYYFGYSATGTNSLCRFCQITDGNRVPVGEQIKRGHINE